MYLKKHTHNKKAGLFWSLWVTGLSRGMKNKQGDRKLRQQRRWGVFVNWSVFFFFVIISAIKVVGVQLKATNSEVLILASKEDKDK